jgi:hypothetical protein
MFYNKKNILNFKKFAKGKMDSTGAAFIPLEVLVSLCKVQVFIKQSISEVSDTLLICGTRDILRLII